MSDGEDLLATPPVNLLFTPEIDLLLTPLDFRLTSVQDILESPGAQEIMGQQIVADTLRQLELEAQQQEELGQQIVADTLRQQAEEAARQEELGRQIVEETLRLIVDEEIPQEQLGREIVDRALAEFNMQVGLEAAAAESIARVDVLDTPPSIWDQSTEWLRKTAEELRTECLSVRLPGIPFAEDIAFAADWWGDQINDWFGGTVRTVGQANDRVTCSVQQTLGVNVPGGCVVDTKPQRSPSAVAGTDDFLVKVPNWQDIFIVNNEKVLDDRSRNAAIADAAESLRRSPTPAGLREVAELLTILDDVQDEASTLAVALMVIEKVAGRAIPGVGQVALLADALNVISAIARPATGSGLPGRTGKRRAKDKARHTGKGYAGRVEEVRRLDKLKIGVGDVLQGLQATESLFGFGVQLGPIFGFLQDAFWGVIRGAEFRAAGPIWDPLGFTEAGRAACYRSPSLDLIHPRSYQVLSHEALSLWSKAGRILPFVDVLGEPALATVLVGLRLAEGVLGPWLRSGVWQAPLLRAIELRERVPGGIQELDTRNVRADEWLKRTVGGTVAATRRAISNVSDRGRQAFYESLVASTGFGLMGSIEPAGRWVDPQIVGPLRDVMTLADVGMYPAFDLGE